MRLAAILVLAVALIAGPALAGFINAPLGYASYETPDIQIGGFIGSFDTYGDKYVFFSGRDVQLISNNGSFMRNVYSFGTTEYADPFYASFVKVMGDNVYIGESSQGTIRVGSLTGDPAVSTFTTLTNNYDIAFDNSGKMFVIAGSDDWMSADIWAVNSDGSTAKVASFAGASGPITFDGAGNLYCAPYDYSGKAKVFKWTAGDVADAIANGETLGIDDSSIIAADVKNPSAFTCDSDGNLYFTSWAVSPATIWKVSALDQSVSEFAKVDPLYSNSGLTGLRYDSATGNFSTIGSLTETTQVWDDELGEWVNQNTYHTRIGTLAPVPEPSAFAALGSMLGMAFFARRRRS